MNPSVELAPSSARAARLFQEELISRDDLAKQSHHSTRWWLRLEQRGGGPPVVRIGRKVFYSMNSVEQWLRSEEQRAARRRSRWGRR